MPSQDVIKKIVDAISLDNDVLRVGVLVSGLGTNLQALIDYSCSESVRFKLACVISNNSDGIALKRAKLAGIKNHFVNHQAFSSRHEFELELADFLMEAQVHLVVLAGFMRRLTPTFLSLFKHRVINLHPSLLPDFKGLHAIEQALCAGVDRVGCTVHLVDEAIDRGDIIEQFSCAIKPKSRIELVKKKIHQLEHELLPKVVNKIAIQALEKSSLEQFNIAAKNYAADYGTNARQGD